MLEESKGWYRPTLENLEPKARKLFETYSKIPSDEVIPHIEAVRDKAWKIFPYPCIGKFHFLDISLSDHPTYPEVLERLKQGESYLDMGCCFGQDIRQLVSDGAPSSNLYGTDLSPDFLDLGYELFKDSPESLSATFIPADALSPTPTPLDEQLTAKINIIHAASFFHLFPLPTQILAAKKVLKLLKPVPGSMIIGRQGGDLKGKDYVQGQGTQHMQSRFWHNSETWKDMWEGVAKDVGVKVDVWSELSVDEKVFVAPKTLGEDDGRAHGRDTRKMVFCVRIVMNLDMRG